MLWNWKLDHATQIGLMPMIPQPSAIVDERWGFSLSARQRYKIHVTLRISDYEINQKKPRWIAFRWIDPEKAREYDAAIGQSLMPTL